MFLGSSVTNRRERDARVEGVVAVVGEERERDDVVEHRGGGDGDAVGEEVQPGQGCL